VSDVLWKRCMTATATCMGIRHACTSAASGQQCR
jgi:hypothetical protein